MVILMINTKPSQTRPHLTPLEKVTRIQLGVSIDTMP
jgi:hypothetical protein